MEGHLTMSKKERARLVVMAKVMKSEMKISEASDLLGLSYRQTFRIAKRYGAEYTTPQKLDRGLRWIAACRKPEEGRQDENKKDT